eukprot:scaffold16069_cov437-Ochromonas_danica.AAC.1
MTEAIARAADFSPEAAVHEVLPHKQRRAGGRGASDGSARHLQRVAGLRGQPARGLGREQI